MLVVIGENTELRLVDIKAIEMIYEPCQWFVNLF